MANLGGVLSGCGCPFCVRGHYGYWDQPHTPIALRARELLFAMLTPDQRREAHRSGAMGCGFTVTGSNGTPFFIRIDAGPSGNVIQLNRDGLPVRSYCAFPRNVPAYDCYLAQKLMLETDALEYDRISRSYW